MDRIAYQDLAPVYDWLVPEVLLTPEGNAAMFEEQIAQVEAGAPILDCACGTGMLAVGLAKRGFKVTATDASPAMVERTERLAREHGVQLAAETCRWEELTERSWPSPFKAVFCVGNSLTHAEDRRAALTAMHAVIAPGGVLVLTTRNWERVRAKPPAGEEEVERGGRRAVVKRWWEIPEAWSHEHAMHIEVALKDGTYGERLTFWPFTESALREDLEATGFRVTESTYGDEADRYLVTAARSS